MQRDEYEVNEERTLPILTLAHQKVDFLLANFKVNDSLDVINLFEVTLLDDKQDAAFITPLCVIIMQGLASSVSLRPEHEKVEVDLRVANIFFNFYNAQLAAFEPLLEPWYEIRQTILTSKGHCKSLSTNKEK